MALPFPLIGADDDPALLGETPEHGTLSHGALRRMLETSAPAFALPAKGLVWLMAPNGVAAASGLLAALAAGHAVSPLDPGLAPERLLALAQRFRPDFVLAPAEDGEAPVPGLERGPDLATGLALWRRPDSLNLVAPVHPDLALVMATSGSTGNPRFARLSRAAVAANTPPSFRCWNWGPASGPCCICPSGTPTAFRSCSATWPPAAASS